MPSDLAPPATTPLFTKPGTAVLLMAHGSRRSAANQDLVILAQHLEQSHLYCRVQVSYLELATPTILEGARLCIHAGASRVLMLPYFLSAGTHVSQDLADLRTALVAEFPRAEFVLCPHLGLHPLMVQIVQDRLSGLETALKEKTPIPQDR